MYKNNWITFFYHAKTCRKKSILKSLKNHELVSHVVDSKTVYCKHVRLDREYDTYLLLRHANNNKCKKAREGKWPITVFFPIKNNTNNSREQHWRVSPTPNTLTSTNVAKIQRSSWQIRKWFKKLNTNFNDEQLRLNVQLPIICKFYDKFNF